MVRTNNKTRTKSLYGSAPFPASTYPKAPFLVFSQGHIPSTCTFLILLVVPLSCLHSLFLHFFHLFTSPTTLHINSSHRKLNTILFWGVCSFGVRNEVTHALKRGIKARNHQSQQFNPNNGNTGYMCWRLGGFFGWSFFQVHIKVITYTH